MICSACGAELAPSAHFCGRCGAAQGAAPEGEGPAPVDSGGGIPLGFTVAVIALVVATVAVALAVVERSSRTSADRATRLEIRHQTNELASLQAQDATLARRVAALKGSLASQKQGIAPLANRVLKSVYTVVSGEELGTAWVAWKRGGTTYLITANHVVADAVGAGNRNVELKQKGRTLPGVVVKRDTTNDLALVSTTGDTGAALWQTPELGVSPVIGDQLLLVGSPYGLEGTVTQGVVSRVTYDAIQTDAAANPGNSGGPAVDREGQVVGVLLEGGGENLNFAAPIQRACVTLRSCT